MAKEVKDLKEKLARGSRMLEMAGLIDFSGHISGRIPGHSTFFIHPATLPRIEVTPDDLIEVELADNERANRGVPQETPIHTAIYQARQDVNSVVHIHSHYSILPSIAGKDLFPVCHHGSIFGPVIPVYPDSEKITTCEQADELVRKLGDGRAVIMRGHGAVVTESSIESVFVAALFLEENAKLLVEASILGNPIPLSEEERKRAAANTFQALSIQKNWAYFMEKGKKAGIFWD